MSAPLVSVVIPSYDRGYFLRTRSLPSLLRQGYESWEAIVVGDGPPDDGVRRAAEGFGDRRIRYVEIPRPDYDGLSPEGRWCIAGAAARNHGLSLARGAVLAPLDDDDEFLPDHLAESVRALEAGADLVYGCVLVRDLEAGTERRDFLPWDAALFERRNVMFHSSVCYSARFAGHRYPETGDVPADYALWLSIHRAGGRVAGIESPQSVYYGDALTARIRCSVPSLPPVEEFGAAAAEIFASRTLTNGGPFARRLEEAVAARVGARHAVAAPSGDAALRMALGAVAARAGGRREVILPSYTFPATASAVLAAGLEPVFCDVDPRSLTVTPETVAPLLSARTAAVMPVHAHGCPAPMPALERLARDAGAALVADAAAAFGAAVEGRPVGGFGDAEIFSFSGTKALTGGEGGMLCTGDAEVAALARRTARYGVDDRYSCQAPGINGKMAELPAALALIGLPRLDGWLAERRAAAARYRALLAGLPGLRMQEPPPGAESTFKDLALVLETPEAAARLAARAASHRVDTRPYYRPLHRMPAFAAAARGALPVTERLADCTVCVPLYSGIRPEVVEMVAGVVADALDGG